MTDIAAAYSRKYFEVQDHVTVVPLFSVFFHGYLNPAWYDGLTDSQKEAISEAGAKAAEMAVAASEEASASAPQQLAENGMTVHVQTPEEAAAWKELMVPAYDKAFGDATGDDGVKLLELISQISN